VFEWGGGGLMDVGCYPITMARWLFGEEPEAAIGIIDRDPELKIDRIVSGLLRFPSGGQATFTSAMQLVHYQRMQLHGTSGRIDVQIPFNAPNDRPCRIFVDSGREREAVSHALIALARHLPRYQRSTAAYARALVEE